MKARESRASAAVEYGSFPKLGGTVLGVPLIRAIVFGGLYWGSPISGNYHIDVSAVLLPMIILYLWINLLATTPDLQAGSFLGVLWL